MSFSVSVIVNSVDVSLKITGQVTVSVIEAGASIAKFIINPDAGAINVYQYIGKSVTIDYIENSVVSRLFTGIVHQPVYNTTTGLLSFDCTDNLQETVEIIGRSAIDAMLPGTWNKSIFSNPSENWTYAQQIMSTYQGSFDKSAHGLIRITDWKPKTTPDYIYTDSTIIHDSLAIEVAKRRNITNSVKIKFQNRYRRLWQRELSGTWDLGKTFGAWLSEPSDLPSKAMIESSVSQWATRSVTFVDLPPSGNFGGIIWGLTDYARTLCTGAGIHVARRWVQNITDVHIITVKDDQSVLNHGLLEIEKTYSVQDKSGSDDPFSEFTDFSEWQPAIGEQIDTQNNIKLTREDFTGPLLTAISHAKTKIVASHRQNKLRFNCVLNPSMHTDKTVQINHAKAVAKGKVSSVRHVINLETGSAVSECAISIIKTG